MNANEFGDMLVERMIVETETTVGFSEMLSYIADAITTFRSDIRKPHDPEKPIIFSYKAGRQAIDIISTDEEKVRIQINIDDGKKRITYVYDGRSGAPILIHHFENADSDDPTSTAQLMPTQENIHTLLSIYDYIRQGTNKTA